MTVRMDKDQIIILEGRCAVEDAETLVRLLSSAPSATVDWRDCDHAHTAVIQALLAACPDMRGPPASKSLRDWIEPVLTEAGR
jgi:hypothetical protein